MSSSRTNRSEKLALGSRRAPSASCGRPRKQATSEFVLESALAQADSVLAQQQIFRLNAKQWAAFTAALDAAPAASRPSASRAERARLSSGRPTDKPGIEKLTKAHNVDRFDSGAVALNDYLKRFAVVNQSVGGAQTYVAALGEEVVGYYSLGTGGVQYEEAPERTRKGRARHPVPVVLLARLAVDVTWQGKGLGAARCCLTRFAASLRPRTSSASAQEYTKLL